MTKIYLAPTVYEKIIKENPEEFKDSEQLGDFIDAYLGTDKSVKELEDSLSEYAEKATIYQMMASDLFYWYDQRLREDYFRLIELMEEAEAETETAEPTEPEATPEAIKE